MNVDELHRLAVGYRVLHAFAMTAAPGTARPSFDSPEAEREFADHLGGAFIALSEEYDRG